ncbi:autotransporter assembly complex protein TamA [Pseudogemmobacter faecipullorum]|uniref:Outer membrane protein assembly factor n=1 Tax=Pseudogemmobacter faecipullorum TaxID=2755041 RepID=A0ABS8CHL0_9RHOB|nr:autotransporter assembly complex family protein [Pseudogemmobacter faecipullorum]MCB5408878.1 outer membrane protein assembly factor [Pseudogemmobacter faecipullorum]
MQKKLRKSGSGTAGQEKPAQLARGRRRNQLRLAVAGLATAASIGAFASGTLAFDGPEFQVVGEDKTLTQLVRRSSLLLAQSDEKVTNPEDLFTAARADYARLLAALYAEGYYAPVIRITLDGREAASIAPLDAPARVGAALIFVDPGPRFAFSRTSVAPLAPRTTLPVDFRAGAPARAGVISEAVSAATLAWREEGHAKVRVSREDILANHPERTLSAVVGLAPGPSLRFGPVSVKGADRMDLRRVLKIAGLNEGTKFSQTELDRAANRLRRSGVFSSVSLTESEQVLPGGLLPIEITVAEHKTRRYSVGAELSSVDGAALSGYWLHRNLLGGGERLRVDASISNIGAGDSGVDYELGVTLDRPATLTPDTTAGILAKIGHLDEVDYDADYAELGLTFTQYFSEQLTLRGGLSYEQVQGRDPTGTFRYRNLSLPFGATWDRRDSTTDAKKGFYIDGTAKPFLGFSDTGSGLRMTLDARGYRSFSDQRFTVAARLQGGAVLGSDLLDTPRDDLFFSGGGGSVRGQTYRSLGIETPDGLGGTYLIGGTEYAAGSLELRARFGESWGGVAFIDAGFVGADGESESHAGAGIGVRYETGFGPIRFDVAAPISGPNDDGVQIYIGLGQAF